MNKKNTVIPGTTLGNGSPPVVDDRKGHKADPDAYKRSKNKSYLRKMEAQRKGKGK